MYLVNNGVLFIHIEKCGGNYIEKALVEHFLGDYVPHVPPGLAKRKSRFKPLKKYQKIMFSNPDWHGHVSLVDYETKYGRLDDCFVFSVVRNPFARVLSAYLHCLRNFPRKSKGSFEAFVDWLFYQKPNFMKTAKQMLHSSFGKDVSVFKLEKISECEEVLRHKYGIVFDGQKQNHSPVSYKTSDYYDPSIMRKVAELYKDDFEEFNYDASVLP